MKTNKNIEENLKSYDLIVRIFAILDRRVGKRRLKSIQSALNIEDEIFNMFLYIRSNAENIVFL